ncbi:MULTISPECIES: hypothetical protein [unclassified Pseudoalteromonas]|uniref:hypothetical protein n=1 Tax=unclassified Pseudoalteromonas TaxID=194690 RepID=UPI00301424F3
MLNEDGEIISLEKLFQAYPDKLLVISDTISYGVFYDQALAALDSKNKTFRGGSSYYETTHRMFESRRVDFILAFPVEVLRYGKNNQAMYQAYTVAGAPKSSIGHLMCNKHSHSEAFLRSINVALNKLYQQPEFLNAHLNFLPEQDHPQIKQLIKQTISSLKLSN